MSLVDPAGADVYLEDKSLQKSLQTMLTFFINEVAEDCRGLIKSDLVDVSCIHASPTCLSPLNCFCDSSGRGFV